MDAHGFGYRGSPSPGNTEPPHRMSPRLQERSTHATRRRPRAAAGAVISLLIAFAGAAGPVGARAESLTVEVVGIGDSLRDNVRAHLGIVAESERSREKDASPPSEAAIRRLHRAAPEEIEKALRPFGYYAPTIDAGLQEMDGAWRAT